jgi:hypothetical protein
VSAPAEPSRQRLFAAEVLGGAPASERLTALRREPLLVALAPGLGWTRRGQLMLAASVNLLARLFDFVGAIDLDADEGPRVLPRVAGLRPGRPLAEEVAHLARALRPDAADVRPVAERGPYARALLLGGTCPVAAREVVHADGAEWLAAVGPEPLPVELPPHGPVFNPLGPLVASAWGASEIARSLFRSLDVGHRPRVFAPLEKTRVWDLWRHEFERPAPAPHLPGALFLGEVGVAGLGALGSAAVFALAQLTRASGTLELVDDDRLSPTNLERVLVACAADLGRPKVELARRWLRGTQLRTVAIRGRYGPGVPPRARASTLLVGVDSGAARRAIVRLLPESLYNGGTQSSELFVSRHVRFQGACLECLYPEAFAPAPARGAQACGRAAVTPELPQATIGFVSALCGFLMTCELVKDRMRVERDQPLDDARPVLRLDLLVGAPDDDCVESYSPRRDCFCREPDTQRRIDALRGG